MTPPVLFLHGLFGRPDLLAPWITRFEAAGYDCQAPALPGRDPTDKAVLRRSGVKESFATVGAARERLTAPPIVVGHSFGGLLAQKLAAETETAALVLLALIPPGVLGPQVRPLPHLFPLLPRILAGRPLLPSARTFRAVPFNTLPAHEQDTLIGQMVPESGRAFRAMTLGTPPTRVERGRVQCQVLCVSGSADRNVSNAASARIARRYHAEHQVHPSAPHWIVAESLADDIVPSVLGWLRRATADPNIHEKTA